MSFEEKVILITGAAGEIGKKTAQLFHRKGARLALVDIDKKALEDATHELGLKNCLLIQADVAKEKEVKNYVQQTIGAYGNIDVFFNNAGISGKLAEITEVKTENLEKSIDINIKGVFYGLKYVLQIMKRQNDGVVINTSSVAGLNGSLFLAPYSATKHAVIGLTKTAALEVAKYNIRVNAICPSPVDTELMSELDKEKNPENPKKARESYSKKIPLGRYATSEEIANLVAFLSSDQSSFITGGSYLIDGGHTASY
ncbi:SDR family NAD(P)-dependent oxidoreductase [Oceanobacillus timonensis]|uniref:SDR family NAD(P)-dependent oxidoreductase n=1 Tax=Oceanobacillus timonensis TaxID=1926285 RepID=UPI0009BB0342|nr:glucose 1-dehydrogenase [Oceanobacillus timonensis]